MDFSLGEVLLGIGGLLAGVGALIVFLRLAELIEGKIDKQKSEDAEG
ncbi:hypothetical protein KGY63_02225 [Candidatus Bipolaricaulota bacterium]|nr:hypothetical protein [Candidatus Bipolaricaulota bacterium]MBS3814182.1 hypothetical protein [Candidatus Bipolaricaulota bacterium]